MKQWEYTFLSIPLRNIEKRLNELGKDNWEVVSFLSVTLEYYDFILKREL